jgi:hypothetical protein
VYRVSLIAGANWMSHLDFDPVRNGHGLGEMETQETLTLDVLPAEHPSIAAYLNHQGGIAVFSDSSSWMVSVNGSVAVIHLCARVLDTKI